MMDPTAWRHSAFAAGHPRPSRSPTRRSHRHAGIQQQEIQVQTGTFITGAEE